MGWFKCKHPFDRLAIEKAETSEKIDNDFNKVTYHYRCMKCNTVLRHSYTKCVGGVEVFLAEIAKRRRNEDTSKQTRR